MGLASLFKEFPTSCPVPYPYTPPKVNVHGLLVLSPPPPSLFFERRKTCYRLALVNGIEFGESPKLSTETEFFAQTCVCVQIPSVKGSRLAFILFFHFFMDYLCECYLVSYGNF